MVWLFWSCAVFLAYTFTGYPSVLWLVSKVRQRGHQKDTIQPRVSIIIPAYNADRLMREKIVNTLELDYPAEKREIIVASDGSMDNTVDIVRSFAARGVKLVEIPKRTGKHYAQMQARDVSQGEILVFTDVSVELEPDALQRIVSNFADSSVGCVSSEDHVRGEPRGRGGEGSYVNFEMWLRRLESQVGSLVSVSGSFFAARRQVCDVWHSGQSSDFFVPLHTAARSLRVVVDPECRGYYGLTQQGDPEFQRKVRTVVHGLDVFFTHLKLLNPLHYPVFAWQLVSHKLCRWLVPFAMAGLWLSNLFLWRAGRFYQASLVLQGVLYAAGLLAMASEKLLRIKPLKLANFFMLGNLATIAAWVKFCLGEKFVLWQPTRRG